MILMLRVSFRVWGLGFGGLAEDLGFRAQVIGGRGSGGSSGRGDGKWNGNWVIGGYKVDIGVILG